LCSFSTLIERAPKSIANISTPSHVIPAVSHVIPAVSHVIPAKAGIHLLTTNN